MRRLTVGLPIAAVAILVAACGGDGKSPASSSTTTSTTPSKPPIAQAALSNLLLTPAEVDSLLGVTGSASKEKIDKLQDDGAKQHPGPPDWKFPDECVYTLGPAEAAVYAGSGNTAVSGDADVTNLGNDQDIMLGQALVLFPSAKEANDFFTTSAQRWPACADRQIDTPAEPDGTLTSIKMGPFSNANGVLSVTETTTVTLSGQPPITIPAQRALTARNNVVVDVILVRKGSAPDGAKVAAAIAGKIDKQP